MMQKTDKKYCGNTSDFPVGGLSLPGAVYFVGVFFNKNKNKHN